MKISEFVEKFVAADNKAKFCEKIIKPIYVPFLDKIAKCEYVVRSTSQYKPEGTEVPVFNQNTPIRFLIFNMTLINLYTELEIDEKNLISEFDKLNECGAIDVLSQALPEREFKEFTTLLSMVTDDYIANNRTMISFIESQMDIISKLTATTKE